MQTLETCVTRASITELVHAFYARVQDDGLLAPVFARHMSQPWDAHMDRMVSFWSSVLLAEPGFRGDPVGRHRAIEELTPEHFDRWMQLFGAVAADVFVPHVAADVTARAGRMRVVLERAAATR